MLKKLRKQFILSSIIPIALITVFAFLGLTATTFYYERSQTITALTAALEGNVNSVFFPNEEIAENFSSINSNSKQLNEERMSSVELIATIDKDKKIAFWISSTNSDISEDDAKNLIEDVVGKIGNDKRATGVIPTYNYRYLIVSTPNGYRVAFSDMTSEITTFLFLVRIFGLISVLILGMMFLVADYMARKAIEPVEESWCAQNRFVADASHELKTPLTVILANMDIIQANKDSKVWEQNKWIENTKSEAARMTELVNDMLFLARSDAQIDQSYNFQEINFSHTAEDCVLSFESLAFEKGISLSSAIPSDLFIVADETRVKQAMMILIDNALKYVNDKGNIFVTAEGNQRQIKFTVANTGEPIPADKQKYLFDRFYRIDDSRAREKGGYGLGLPIAHNIMDAHGGSVNLEYSNENGTCFALCFPIRRNKLF